MTTLPNGFNYRILVVDDEPGILKTSAAILESRGFEVRTANDGFAALAELRRSLPDVIISDLRMPNMSGFELLAVVRRRFPNIAVIAISGEYHGAPASLLADAFLNKTEYTPEQLFGKILALLETPLRAHVPKLDKAPVWLPRSDTGYFVVTCPECLRSFSIPEEHSGSEVRETNCIFCDSKIHYLADMKTPRKPVHYAS